MRLGVDGVSLNDGHVVAINAEGIERITRERDETETVAVDSDYLFSGQATFRQMSHTHRFPCVTLMTERSPVPVVADRPNPLMSVESAPSLIH